MLPVNLLTILDQLFFYCLFNTIYIVYLTQYKHNDFHM